MHTNLIGQKTGFVCIPLYTVSIERFTGLKNHSFSPMKVFAGILLQCLGQQCLLFTYSKVFKGKTFVVLLKTAKTAKVSPANLAPFTVNSRNMKT